MRDSLKKKKGGIKECVLARTGPLLQDVKQRKDVSKVKSKADPGWGVLVPNHVPERDSLEK